MNETRALVEAFEAAIARMDRCALATLVSVDGSSYRRPGARMLICESGEVSGSVSAGCLESDVVQQAMQVIGRREPKVVEYDTASTSEEVAWGLGLGCNGIVRLLIEPLPVDSPYLDALRRSLTLPAGAEIVVVTVFGASSVAVPVATRLIINESLHVAHNCPDGRVAEILEREASVPRGSAAQADTRILDDGALSLFVEALRPPVSLIVFGAGQDALPVVEAAQMIGWHVEVVDPQARPMTLARFARADKVTLTHLRDVTETVNVTAGTMALVMTHHFGQDLALLQFLVRSPARYIGMVGARKRAERMLVGLSLLDESLPLEGPGANRVHAPAGIDIGADGPVEIALSIIAEMRAVINGRTGGVLRDTTALVDTTSKESVAAESRDWIANAAACAGGASWASVR